MSLRGTGLALWLAALCAGAGHARRAGAELVVPPGLNPGDVYHLAFVSSTTRDALSPEISEYDAHVQAAADAAGIGVTEGVSWVVIGSTATVDAMDHVGVSGPVYRLDGVKIADDADDLWDETLDAPLSVTESGESVETWPWTGTDRDGMGRNALGGPVTIWVDMGKCTDTNWRWLATGFDRYTNNHPLYAVSELLTAPLAPGPVWTAMARTDTEEVTVSFSSVSGRHYLVWFAPDLVATNWGTNAASGVTATGDTTNWPDPAAGEATRAYRVESLP